MAPEARPPHLKPRLGRGLSSLIVSSTHAAGDAQHYRPVPEAPAVAQLPQPSPGSPVPQGGAATEIPIDQIGPNPYQPRKDFRAEDLADLARSIAAQGILQPLLVARAEDPTQQPYLLVAGERRIRAARLAGLHTVPCVVRQATKQQMLEWALVENIQRSDLNPVERAQAYREYMDRFSLTQADAAERLGQPRATVANYLRMLDLSDEIQRMIVDGHLSFGHAKVLAGLTTAPERQLALARRTASEGLSVRILERLVTNAAAEGAVPVTEQPPPSGRTKPAYLRDLEEQLSRAVATRVTLLPGRAKHTGRIVVEYYSLDDFDRIAKLLGLRVET